MLVEENYFSKENQLYYTGSSQIKSFLNCSAKAMAEINEDWKEEPSQALLVGSYIDNAVSGTLDIFVAQHPEMFKKDGTLKSEYQKAEYALQRIQRDKMFWKYVNGNHQIIMTAVYNCLTNEWFTEEEALTLTQVDNNLVPIKIKIDSYFSEKAIVDMKYVKDFKPVWNEKTNRKENFIDYWGYTLQGALYQKVVEVNTGLRLPFFIAAVTKEEEPDLGIFSIPQEVLEEQLTFLTEGGVLGQIQEMKSGVKEAPRCECCNYCKFTKELKEIKDYRDL